MTKCRIENWDGDLAFKLPDDLVAELEVHEGDHLDFEVEEGKLRVWKVPRPDPPPPQE